MISLYESQCPQASDEPGHYDALFAYAQKRLDKCVFGEKPACKQCPVHCYQSETRRDEANYALGWAENALASSDSDRASSD
jgi:aldehyde:ferredoxin oxidoreductase